MKVLLKLAFLLFAVFLIIPAQAQMKGDHAPKSKSMNHHGKEVLLTQAPAAVQAAVNGNQFKGWEASKVMHINKDGREYYKVMFKKGDETVYHKFNTDGTLKPSKTGETMKAVKEEKSKS
jgi:hypothetical protein